MSSTERKYKESLIQANRRHETDTGSPEVQIGILTERLSYLMTHFKSHPQDLHSKQGLFRAVSRRKRLLDYLKHEDITRYRTALETFGLRK